MDFKQAVESLCDRVGLTRPAWSGRAGLGQGEEKLRAAVKKALDLAAALYADALELREDPEAEAARQYILGRRQLTKAVIKEYRAGWAPRLSNWLFTILVTKHGIEPRVLEKAGLAAVSSRTGRYLDFFRGRIMFPVADPQGNICGFGGRVLPEDSAPKGRLPAAGGQGGTASEGPKYLNSPDTYFFKKGETLYGLGAHKGRIREQDKAYIVEGYFDVLGLAQAGLPLAASPMGGALTPDQVRILKRFASKVVLIFDPDAAGISSAVRAGRICLAAGLEVKIMLLSGGLDPDEFVLKYGRQEFERLEAGQAKDLIDFEMESRLGPQGASGLGLEERLRLAKNILPSLAAMPGAIERREAIIRAAQALRLDLTGFERELDRYLSRSSGREVILEPKNSRPSPGQAASDQRGKTVLSLDEALLGLALYDKAAVRKTLEKAGVKTEDFIEPQIARYIYGEKAGPNSGEESDAPWQEMLGRAALTQSNDLTEAEFSRLLDEYAAEMRQRALVKEFRRLREDIRRCQDSRTACDESVVRRFQEVSRLLKTGNKE